MSEEAPSIQAREHLKEIILLLSVPIAIIVISIALVYIPRLFASPKYDFIYCEGYGCNNRFSVNSEGRLLSTAETNRYPYDDYRLHYYDLKRDSTRPIQTADATSYLLEPSSKSPEGYVLQQNTNSGGFLFWSDYSSDWSLKRGMATKPVSLEGNDIKLMGWVLVSE